jgi:hypothetical protein
MSKSHFVWQQRVTNKEENAVYTILTFGELPGINNVENDEESIRRLYNKGIQVNYVDIDANETFALQAQLDGKYIKAKVANVLPESFVLESYSQWGVFEERSGDGSPPSLLRYYTCASHASASDENFRKVQKASTNILRGDLQIVSQSEKCNSQGDIYVNKADENHQSVCVRITVTYDNVSIPFSEVSVFHGDSKLKSKPTKVVTNIDGVAYISVPRADKRVYIRINYKININPSEEEEINGETYEFISNWATSVLEFSSNLEVFPFLSDYD